MGAGLADPVVPAAGRGFTAARRILLALLSLFLLAAVMHRLPRIMGTTWAAMAVDLRSVTATELAGLGAIWVLSVWCHSWVLTAALPGLGRVRAMMLNLSGSAVGDVVPFGAAAGAGMNLTMIRSWRFPAAASLTFLTVSNLWNVVAKLLLPVVALALVSATGADGFGGAGRPGMVTVATRAAGVALVLVLAACVALVVRPPVAALGRWVRQDVAVVIRRGWRQLTFGMAGQLALQALMWVLCLRIFGVALPLTAALVGFAVERALTMLPFTPSGAGLAEVGGISVLLWLGAGSETATAAVLLFRAFVYLLEIPTGAVSILAWLWWRPREVAG